MGDIGRMFFHRFANIYKLRKSKSVNCVIMGSVNHDFSIWRKYDFRNHSFGLLKDLRLLKSYTIAVDVT